MQKLESQTLSRIELKKLCGFTKGRIHATFSDNSSLIFQNNNGKNGSKFKIMWLDCITYFFANGEKIRFYLENTPTRDEIKLKVQLALKV